MMRPPPSIYLTQSRALSCASPLTPPLTRSPSTRGGTVLKHVALLFSLVVLATGRVAPASAQSLELETVLSRAGEYVEQYYTRTQSLLVEEIVILQPFSRSWSFEGFPRRLEYELRVEWDPSATEEPARVVRELVRASGPRLGPLDQPDCMDPRAISPEPLAFLLPDRRNTFSFEVAGSTRVDGRDARLPSRGARAAHGGMDRPLCLGRPDRPYARARLGGCGHFRDPPLRRAPRRARRHPAPTRSEPLRAATVYLRASRQLDSLRARDVRESGRNSHAAGADREDDRRPELRRSAAAHHTDYDNYRRFVTDSRIVRQSHFVPSPPKR